MGPPTCPITPNIGLRTTLYVDNIVNSIEFALRSGELERVDKFAVDTVLALGVSFGLEGSVEVTLSDEEQKKAQYVARRKAENKGRERQTSATLHSCGLQFMVQFAQVDSQVLAPAAPGLHQGHSPS